jgi:hypothetical protein
MRFFFRAHRATTTSPDTHRYGTEADGSRNTIHAGGKLDIEVDDDGRPVAVWFRCLNLPFSVWLRASGEPAHINPAGMEILNIEYTETVEEA